MNILCFADTRFPIERANGVQTMATCHALASRGHTVTLLARADTAEPPRDPFAFYDWAPEARLRIDAVPGMKHPGARRAQFLLAALGRVASTRTGVVLTRDLGLAAFILQLPARRRLPLVYESHGISVIVSGEMPALLGQPALAPSRRKLERLERRERRVWRRAEGYVTITRALRDELVSRYGARESVFVVPDGVRLPADEGPTGSRPPDLHRQAVAGYAGHLYPWKGVDIFVNALAHTSGIRGLIVGGHPGEPDRARVEALVRNLGLTDRVEITGLVSPPDVRARLRAATMLILPNAKSAMSERYTSPLKLFEYLALGRPIIAADLPSIREVLTDDATALLVPAGDPHALASAMTRVAGDGALASRLGIASRALAPQYTWDRRAERLEAALAGGGRPMISPRLLEVVRCPDCAGTLGASGAMLTCGACGRTFDTAAGYADLRPAAAYAEQTKYLDAALHTDARHETVAPPLLGSKIRNDMLRAFLQLQPGERVLDLGCGSGRTMIWNADTGARLTGIDISPFFSREALEGCDLALGDLRRLPLKDDAFQKAWALDVLEHLSPQALRDVLRDAGRVLAPGGVLFLYTHVRKNGPLGVGVRWVNHFAHLCERIGLIDLRQERLRKSDHLNPIADHDELIRVLAECGFHLDRITYYTPIAGAFVENVIIRIAERFMTRQASRTTGVDAGAASRAARSAAKTRLRRGGPTYLALRALTAFMMLDVHLFGRFKSGPFFALVRKTGTPGPA